MEMLKRFVGKQNIFIVIYKIDNSIASNNKNSFTILHNCFSLKLGVCLREFI